MASATFLTDKSANSNGQMNKLAEKAASQAANDCLTGLFSLAPVFMVAVLVLLVVRVNPMTLYRLSPCLSVVLYAVPLFVLIVGLLSRLKVSVAVTEKTQAST